MIEDLYARAADIAAFEIHPGEQRIIPAITFASHGVLQSWTFAAEHSTNGTLLPEIQIWRNTGQGSDYAKVQSSDANALPVETGYLNVY